MGNRVCPGTQRSLAELLSCATRGYRSNSFFIVFRSLRRILPAIVVVLLVLIDSIPAEAAKVRLDGTSYQIRRGETEDDDYVLPYPPEWTPGPYCFKMGTTIRIRIVPDPGETITIWKVTGASLYSPALDIWYWDIPESGWLTVDQTYELPPLPPYIDAVTLEGDVVMDIGPGPPGGGAGPLSGRYSDIYVVMDAPKVPAMKSQRTNSLVGSRFSYNSLKPAGYALAQTGTWRYHQVGLVGSNAWDGCILITGFGIPTGWDRDTTYYDRLVNTYVLGLWSPMPGGGLVPVVTTIPP